MSRLRLFGFTAAEQETLHHALHPVPCDDLGRLEMREGAPPLEEEVWVVSVGAAAAFLEAGGSVHATDQRPPAVLWVPEGQAPLACDLWVSTFILQLEATREGDWATLRRLSRCPQVLAWGPWVAAVPAAWFASLTASPLFCRVDDLPFRADAQQHLWACLPCLEEAYTLLQQRAAFRWAVVCPSVEVLARGLVAGGGDATVEAHVASCGLCRAMVQSWGELQEEGGQRAAAHGHAQRTAGGVGEPADRG